MANKKKVGNHCCSKPKVKSALTQGRPQPQHVSVWMKTDDVFGHLFSLVYGKAMCVSQFPAVSAEHVILSKAHFHWFQHF